MINDEEVRKQLLLMATLLTDQTTTGRIEWKTGRRESEFTASGPNSGVRVFSWVDDEGDTNYVLEVMNPRGQAVAELRSEWDGAVTRPRPWNRDLAKLYNTARRQALNVDGLLDATLADLKEGNFSPDTPPF